uniref:Uncharacterized protein n=1 Tax=Glossina palpalis gambiensis TaxID=67801 RepID=A0A1B0AYU4_9MUSC
MKITLTSSLFLKATSLQCEGMQITLQSKADTVKIAVENTFNYCIRNMFMFVSMAEQIIFCVTYFIHPKHWSLLKVLKFFNLNNGPLNKFSLLCQIEISLVSHGVEIALSLCIKNYTKHARDYELSVECHA